jgi:hypothetical protein
MQEVAVAGKLGWRCGRILALAGVLAVTVSACNGSTGLAARAGQPATTSAASLAAGQTGPRSAVPWQKVGPGWVLAEYWPGRQGFPGELRSAAATLYLFDPAGGRYRLYRWPVTKTPPHLTDWSGDKTRALVSTQDGAEQVVLATGKVIRFRLAGQAQVIGYTRPGGQGLLGQRQAGASFQLARYQLNGRLVKVLVSHVGSTSAVYSPTGATLAVGTGHGLQLVSNHGGILRQLPVPGVTGSCFPARWWTADVVLASCRATGSSRSRLWLVPADGTRPTALTAQRGQHSPDHGDVGAWPVHGRLYLQTVMPSGTGQIFRQKTDGQITKVIFPGTQGNNWIGTASGSRLLVNANTPCYDSDSLLWFNPATRRENPLIKTPRGLAGVVGVVAYGQPGGEFHVGYSCI